MYSRRIGFYQPSCISGQRTPVYSMNGRKLAYLEDGGWITDLDGYLIARIIRYHEEAAPTASKDCCGSTMITPEDQHEG